MEYIGNAKIVTRLPQIGEMHEHAPQMYGKARKIERIGKENGYTIYRVIYKREEDMYTGDGFDEAPFTYAIKDKSTMTLLELKNIIENGGATLAKSGAAVNFDRGYQVSKKDCYTLNVSNVGRVLRAVNSLLRSIKSGEFVGLWVDNGLIYIDVSERIPRLYDAMRLGIERNQKSIFDWCTRLCFSCEV